ncbi:MAG TPA: GntR family transcriptional regulator [Clostridiales bacterium]|nr:GntR family transcriptional regulator [Clostridiales bacterium]
MEIGNNKSVRRDSNNTLYSQLEEIIRDEIDSGKINPGQAIPSERELSKIYGLSRMTVRHALNRLVSAGLLTRVSGKGTYVSAPKINFRALTLEGLREQTYQMGKDFSSTLINFEKILAEGSIVQNLKVLQDTPIYKIERLFHVDNVPISMHKSYIPCELAPGLMDHDLTNESLYTFLREKYDIVMNRANETLETILASPGEMLLLDVPSGAPIFLLRITMFDQKDRPIEYVKVLFRGDIVQLSLVI